LRNAFVAVRPSDSPEVGFWEVGDAINQQHSSQSHSEVVGVRCSLTVEAPFMHKQLQGNPLRAQTAVAANTFSERAGDNSVSSLCRERTDWNYLANFNPLDERPLCRRIWDFPKDRGSEPEKLRR